MGICNARGRLVAWGVTAQNFSVLLILEYQQHAEQLLLFLMLSLVVHGVLFRELVLHRRHVSVGNIRRLLLGVPVLNQR